MIPGALAATRAHGAAAAAFLALSVLLTWPLAGHMTTHVPGNVDGDNFTFLWNFWWMRQALTSATDAMFFSQFLFAPAGVDLTLHTYFATGAFVGATILRGLSIVTALNLVVIGSVALNGFTAYLLAWRTTGDRAGALVAGLFFAASPYFTGRLRGHFNLLAAWCLPAFWLAFATALDRRHRPERGAERAGFDVAQPALSPGRRAEVDAKWGWGPISPLRTWTWTILAAATVVVTAYTDYYYTVFAGVLAACLLAARWIRVDVSRSQPPRARRAIDSTLLVLAIALMAGGLVAAGTGGVVTQVLGQRISITSGFNLRTAAWVCLLVWAWRRWRPIARFSHAPAADVAGDCRVTATVVAISIAAVLPLAVRAWDLWQRGDYLSQTYFWRSAPGGIDIATLVLGMPWHSLWGSAVQRLYSFAQIDAMESVAWFGIVPLVVLWATRAAWWRAPDPAATRTVAVVFGLWALGPFLVVFGANTGLYLPEILLRYLPIVANARIPGRAIVMVYLVVAVWLAMAVASRTVARRAISAVLLAAAVLAEFIAVPLPLRQLDTPVISVRLASLPAGAVIELPLGIRDGLGERGALDHRTLYYQSIHGKPQAGGFVARLPASVAANYRESLLLSALLDLSDGIMLPGETLVAARDTGATFCRSHGFRYVVLNTQTASTHLQAFVRSLPWLTLDRVEGGRELFVVQ